MEIVDREYEQSRLRDLAADDQPRMALVYGRRRIGKTYLLSHLWEDEEVFYFTASSVTPEQNRRQLVRRISTWSGQQLHPDDYPNWRTLFRLLLTIESPGPVVIVLDEFQYFGDGREDLGAVTSQLNAVWEGPEGPTGPLLLVLCGSAVRTMEALDAGSAPLHGRLDWKVQLEPFDYFDAAELASFRQLRDRTSAYGVFGGTPQYLAAVEPDRSLGENVVRLMLRPGGEVRTQVETALRQEQGLREIPKYVGILHAIGAGRTELSEIANRVGLPKQSTVREKIDRLVDLGYIRRQRNFDAGRTNPWRYRLEDPAFRFYHEFVTRYETALETGDPHRVWNDHVAGQLDRYMGHLFEQVVEEAYYRLQSERELPLVDEWSRWEGTDRRGESLEIDIVSELVTGGMLTGAIKWNRDPIGIEVHRNHLRDLDRLADAGRQFAHRAREDGSRLLYVAAGGFKDGFEDRAREEGLPVTLWSLEDMYGERE